MVDEKLANVLAHEIAAIERDGDLVVTSPSVTPLAGRLAEAALTIVPHSELTHLEMLGVRSLILHAISDSRFFDWEMPTLTGFSADEFKAIADKLPRD